MSSFATTGVDLEGIMISELNRERQLLCDLTYMWNLKARQNTINIKNTKLIEKDQIYHHQRWGEGCRELDKSRKNLQILSNKVNKY